MKPEIKKCECGLTWKLTKHKAPFGIRDSDSLTCTCGRELISWNGGCIWVAELIPEQENSK